MSQSYRSGFNPMMFRKNVKHSGKPKHEANQFIYDKFVSMRDSAGQKQNKGAYHCYNKILKTLEKYPMPVLNGTFPSLSITISKTGARVRGSRSQDCSDYCKFNHKALCLKNSRPQSRSRSGLVTRRTDSR